MRVKFCGNVRPPESFSEAVEWVKAAEEAGLEMLGVADSQSIYHDVYLTLAMLATHSKTIRLGPAVTNPITRHPVVTAGCIAGIDMLSGGRAFLGIATGHTAAINLDLPAATLAHLRDYVAAVRSCMAGRPVEYQGRHPLFKVKSRQVPVYIGATGPRAMRLAGQIGDGVFIRTALFPKVIEFCLEQVRAGAREAGRDPASVDVWFVVSTNIAPTRAEAVDGVKATCVSAAHSVFARRIDPLMAPPHIVPSIQEMMRRYVAADHTKQSPTNRNGRIFDELGFGDYLLEGFALAGTPKECAARIRRLADAGANQLFLGLHMNKKVQALQLLAREVVPQLKQG